MICFVGIHHKKGLPALCSSTISGKKIDAVIALINLPCEKVNLFSGDHIPDSSTEEYDRQMAIFFDKVTDGKKVIVLLGAAVLKHFPGTHYRKCKIIAYRHPAFSPPSFAKNLASLVVNANFRLMMKHELIY